MADESGNLTEDQIEHWRRALYMMVGPYALIAPVEEVQKMRDNMQEYIDSGALDKANHRAAEPSKGNQLMASGATGVSGRFNQEDKCQ